MYSLVLGQRTPPVSGMPIVCGSYTYIPWAARYNTWLLIQLTPESVVLSFLTVMSARNCYALCVTLLCATGQETDRECCPGNRHDAAHEAVGCLQRGPLGAA